MFKEELLPLEIYKKIIIGGTILCLNMLQNNPEGRVGYRWNKIIIVITEVKWCTLGVILFIPLFLDLELTNVFNIPLKIM